MPWSTWRYSIMHSFSLFIPCYYKILISVIIQVMPANQIRVVNQRAIIILILMLLNRNYKSKKKKYRSLRQHCIRLRTRACGQWLNTNIMLWYTALVVHSYFTVLLTCLKEIRVQTGCPEWAPSELECWFIPIEAWHHGYGIWIVSFLVRPSIC